MRVKILLTVIISLSVCLVIINLLVIPTNKSSYSPKAENIMPTITTQPTPTPTPLPKYVKPTLALKNEYTILLLGDSMTDYLRPHSQILINQLKVQYPDKDFNILNYGFGATNILSVISRLENQNEYVGEVHPPINNTDFDIIFIESFGYNPLSEHPIDEGLALQTSELQKVYMSLRETHPNSIMIFMATIAPNKKLFGTNVVDLSEEDRIRWADERISYINNHINFAIKYEIPLLNVFETSLDENNDGDLRYISKNDHIHPSAEGVHFIFGEISKFIIENQLLPVSI